MTKKKNEIEITDEQLFNKMGLKTYIIYKEAELKQILQNGERVVVTDKGKERSHVWWYEITLIKNGFEIIIKSSSYGSNHVKFSDVEEAFNKIKQLTELENDLAIIQQKQKKERKPWYRW